MKEEIYYCDKCKVKSDYGHFGLTKVIIQRLSGTTEVELCPDCLKLIEDALKEGEK